MLLRIAAVVIITYGFTYEGPQRLKHSIPTWNFNRWSDQNSSHHGLPRVQKKISTCMSHVGNDTLFSLLDMFNSDCGFFQPPEFYFYFSWCHHVRSDIHFLLSRLLRVWSQPIPAYCRRQCHQDSCMSHRSLQTNAMWCWQSWLCGYTIVGCWSASIISLQDLQVCCDAPAWGITKARDGVFKSLLSFIFPSSGRMKR